MLYTCGQIFIVSVLLEIQCVIFLFYIILDKPFPAFYKSRAHSPHRRPGNRFKQVSWMPETIYHAKTHMTFLSAVSRAIKEKSSPPPPWMPTHGVCPCYILQMLSVKQGSSMRQLFLFFLTSLLDNSSRVGNEPLTSPTQSECYNYYVTESVWNINLNQHLIHLFCEKIFPKQTREFHKIRRFEESTHKADGDLVWFEQLSSDMYEQLAWSQVLCCLVSVCASECNICDSSSMNLGTCK